MRKKLKTDICIALAVCILLAACGFVISAGEPAVVVPESETSSVPQTSADSDLSAEAARKEFFRRASSFAGQNALENPEDTAIGSYATGNNTTVPYKTPNNTSGAYGTNTNTAATELRGFWLSYGEVSEICDNAANAEQFIKKAAAVFGNIASRGFNTVYVHVRAFSDAFYPSAYFPWSKYVTGVQGRAPSYDPLSLMVQTAHAYGLHIEAWINPYRVLYSTDTSLLSDTNPAKKMYLADKTGENLIFTEKGIFYNPASEQARRLIIDGVREIVAGYDVDGIHIDDYFYPCTDTYIDDVSYSEYKNAGGRLALDDWRRENVNAVVSGMYAAVKAIKPGVLFGISPGGNIERNRNELYADVARWLCSDGYCDYMIPQLYYGFDNSSKPFVSSLNEWLSIAGNPNIKLYLGLALYKSGKADSADRTEQSANEWITHSDIIARQIQVLRQCPRLNGFVLFSYRDFFGSGLENNTINEINNILAIIK